MAHRGPVGTEPSWLYIDEGRGRSPHFLTLLELERSHLRANLPVDCPAPAVEPLGQVRESRFPQAAVEQLTHGTHMVNPCLHSHDQRGQYPRPHEKCLSGWVAVLSILHPHHQSSCKLCLSHSMCCADRFIHNYWVSQHREKPNKPGNMHAPTMISQMRW